MVGASRPYLKWDVLNGMESNIECFAEDKSVTLLDVVVWVKYIPYRLAYFNYWFPVSCAICGVANLYGMQKKAHG